MLTFSDQAFIYGIHILLQTNQNFAQPSESTGQVQLDYFKAFI